MRFQIKNNSTFEDSHDISYAEFKTYGIHVNFKSSVKCRVKNDTTHVEFNIPSAVFKYGTYLYHSLE